MRREDDGEGKGREQESQSQKQVNIGIPIALTLLPSDENWKFQLSLIGRRSSIIRP